MLRLLRLARNFQSHNSQRFTSASTSTSNPVIARVKGVSKATAKIPSLKQFIHLQRVTSLYRSLLRLTSTTGPAPELRTRVMTGFHEGKHLTDGDPRLGLGLKEATEGRNFLLRGLGGADDVDGWRNSNDDDDGDGDGGEEEVDGRVGTGWPWERS